MVRIHNIETDEIIDREMNDEEFIDWQKSVEEFEKLRLKAENEVELKNQLLNKLGITEDEAKLLLS